MPLIRFHQTTASRLSDREAAGSISCQCPEPTKLPRGAMRPAFPDGKWIAYYAAVPMDGSSSALAAARRTVRGAPEATTAGFPMRDTGLAAGQSARAFEGADGWALGIGGNAIDEVSHPHPFREDERRLCACRARALGRDRFCFGEQERTCILGLALDPWLRLPKSPPAYQ